ncbi:MAG: DNA methylase [Phycisphaerae bacterium]|nr:DNA methylase [Phycisphaerae bacterium]
MAGSPAHRWGQIIGKVLEAAVLPILTEFAGKHHLYLDRHGARPARQGKKCRWFDGNGNSHDLDYVLERGGSPEKIGTPVAFLEAAWRRYTKHSRNKAQEIQGAILPLAETYRNSAPFKGAILAGVFTNGALSQMRSLGFTLLYFPYKMIVSTFAEFGIDASFEEDTPDREFQKKVDRFKTLPGKKQSELAARLMKKNARRVDEFIRELTRSVSMRIERIVVLPLHGSAEQFPGIEFAIHFIQSYNANDGVKPIQRYEIQIHYSNEDVIEGRFADKETALKFLEGYRLRGQ